TDLWALPLEGDKKPFPLVEGPGADNNATFSPDGHWFAYQAADASVAQVYVQPFPPTGGRFQISRDGGRQPRWRGDGKEIFFLGFDGTMMAASVDTTKDFQAGLPRTLFATPAIAAGNAL